MQGEGEEAETSRSAPLFSSARFDEDSIFIYPLLAVLAVALYLAGLGYFALVPVVAVVAIFSVEALERVYIDGAALQREIVGEKCVVVKLVSREERGVVRLVGEDGAPEWELWSAESHIPLKEGSVARVRGRDGLFLLVEPVQN